MSKSWSRREALRALGIGAGSLLPLSSWSETNETGMPILLPDIEIQLEKPITVITLGAGNRGNVYGNYAEKYPEQLDIIGVAEPIAIRNDRYAQKHQIKDENRFNTWEDVFKKPKFADAVIISTPDQLHYGPCMKALEMGYDVLLEKPISPSEQECRNILQLAKKTGRIVAVCHVLRYAPYFIKLREFLYRNQQIINQALDNYAELRQYSKFNTIYFFAVDDRKNTYKIGTTTDIINRLRISTMKVHSNGYRTTPNNRSELNFFSTTYYLR